MRHIVEKVQPTKVKDNIGNTKTSYPSIGTVKTSHFIPVNSGKAKQEYGFDVKLAFKTFTYDVVEPNEFLKKDGVVYHVLNVSKFPRHRELLVEVVE
jgi:hypothetical protein